MYNIIEGVVSVAFGYQDESLSLFGFGVDSFVEVVSGIAVAHMVWRMRRSGEEMYDRFEKEALRVTGISFYILAAGLVVGSVLNLVQHRVPETTIAGVIVSTVSIVSMWLLFRKKLQVGHALRSDAILADAGCTKTCYYLSFILLGASLLYELFHIPYVDLLGSLGIAYFAYREGREALEKAKSGSVSCCGGSSCCSTKH